MSEGKGMKVTSTRTFLEIKLGSHQTVETILFLRRSDIDWFNNENIFPEFMSVLEKSVVPRMFHEELDEVLTTKVYRKKMPHELGPGGNPIEEENGPAKKKKKKKKLTKKALVEKKRKEREAERKTKTKDAYYAKGNGIRLTYRVEPVKESKSVTLLFGEGDDEVDLAGNFKLLHKVSKKLSIWCFPAAQDADEPDPEDGGFPRPELIPIAELFHGVNEEED